MSQRIAETVLIIGIGLISAGVVMLTDASPWVVVAVLIFWLVWYWRGESA